MIDMRCKFLDWDSTFFGVRIAQIEAQHLTDESVEQVFEWCREQEIRCLYFLCTADDDQSVMLAEQHGFHLVDVRIEFSYRVPASGERASPIGSHIVRLFQESDLAKLQQIVKGAYETTRFYYDHNFSREQVAALYQEWITKSCRGFAAAVLVTEHKGEATGFVTCHLDTARTGRIGLLGVGVDVRGTGLGRLLLQTAQGYFRGQGVTEVSVVTQGRNLAAQRLYQANGFRASKLQLWYHKWFEVDPA